MFKQHIKYICKIHRNKKIIIYTVHYYLNVGLSTHNTTQHNTTAKTRWVFRVISQK